MSNWVAQNQVKHMDNTWTIDFMVGILSHLLQILNYTVRVKSFEFWVKGFRLTRNPKPETQNSKNTDGLSTILFRKPTDGGKDAKDRVSTV